MKRFFGFIGISGIGWLMDMAIYSLLTMAAGLPVALANCLSSFAAISFVFSGYFTIFPGQRFVFSKLRMEYKQSGLREGPS